MFGRPGDLAAWRPGGLAAWRESGEESGRKPVRPVESPGRSGRSRVQAGPAGREPERKRPSEPKLGGAWQSYGVSPGASASLRYSRGRCHP